MPLLEARDVYKHFLHPKRIDILNGVTLSIERGETISITGTSGCGKSTLLHILGSLGEPSQGTLSFLGTRIAENHLPFLRNREMGFIFQLSYLFEERTVLDNLLLKASIGRFTTDKGSASYKEALSLLERVGMEDRKDFPVKFLSGGEKQRVAIARALVNNPSLILADEPTGNLDTLTSTKIQNLLLSLCREKDKSLILVTHDLTFAALTDRHLLLSEGKLRDV